MATFIRTNSSSSISSLSSVGSDNSDVVGKAGKNIQDPAKSKNLVQRTRDALGDIGNRLKKNPVALGAGGKSIVVKKAQAGSKNEFAVPDKRPPRALKPKTQAGSKLQTKSQPVSRNETPIPASVLVTAKSAFQTTENLSTIDYEGKTGNGLEQILPLQKHDENKENVPTTLQPEVSSKHLCEVPVSNLVSEEGGEIDNEYNPKLSGEVELVEAFSSERLNVANIDVDEWNPLLVQVYIKEIYDYVFSLEKKYPIRIRYLEGRLINSRMRAVLLDWLIEVHSQFGFMPETLYLATKILDRYLQTDRNVTRKQLQLVGVTAMYIAAKYEEVCTPAVQDFAAVSDNAFTVGDVRKMEGDMLTTLSFDLAFPPAVLFLRRFSKAANASMSIHSMAKYIMELSLVDYSACHLFPSEQAAGSLALALLILENKSLSELWNPTVQHYTRYSIDSIKSIVSLLAGVLSRANEEPQKLKAVYSKYTRKRLNNTSLAPELKIDAWKNRVLKEVCKL